MKQVVLDSGVLALACLAEQGDAAVYSLMDQARQKAVMIWVHPQSIPEAMTQLKNQGQGRAALLMAEVLKTVRLLPTSGLQCLRCLEELQGLDENTVDYATLLTLIASREYLEDFVLVSLDADCAFQDVHAVPPEACLELCKKNAHGGPTPFVDLKAQQREILPILEDNLFQVVKGCRFILGPEVKRLEQRLAEYVQSEHAISCSSGTEALVLALLALDIGPGDAVFTTPFTFIATAGAICQTGAVPVFVDIDRRSFNLDPDRLQAAIHALASNNASSHPLPQITSALKPKAVITVDLFGLPADHLRISAIAAEHGLTVIEDAAQSFGAEQHGVKACALGEIGCTSFFPAKPLGAYGEGGACFTNNTALAEAMRSIRVHGQGTSRYEHARLGTNARLDSMQAAVLLAKMDVFTAERQSRAERAAAYSSLLGAVSGLLLPHIPEGFVSAWAQYSLLAGNSRHRDACRKSLQEQGVPTMVYYPVPLHLQRVFAHLGYDAGDFPAAEATARRIFSLPMHPYLSGTTQQRIAAALRAVVSMHNFEGPQGNQ